MYVAYVKHCKKIENVEYLRIRDGEVESVRCYFGAQNSYPELTHIGITRLR